MAKQCILRVLHVEDHLGSRLFVRKILELAGYQVASFGTLPEAKAAAVSRDFEYFICDGEIGSDDGGIWAQELRRAGKRVMMLSERDQENGVPALGKRSLGDGQPLLRMLESL